MRAVKKATSSTWFFPILILIGYSGLYFKLKDLFLFTPDFTATDILHYSTSYKYLLWQSIRAGVIPFWTHLVGGGFPLLAESPVGMLFLPYYIIFPLFSTFSHALAFLFCFHLFIMTYGMYLFLAEHTSDRFLAFILSIIFVWNGAITFRWVHLVVLQAFSFTPLLFWLYMRWSKTGVKRYLVFFALVLNQMILVGYIQAVFIALLALCCHFIINSHTRTQAISGMLAIAGGFILSLPQIIPTIQLAQFASRQLVSTYEFAVSVPFNLNNLCSFFLPNCLGSAQNATYNTNWQASGVYWENTPYMGIFFMILIILASAYTFILRKSNKNILIYLLLFIIFVLLALGKNSPLYFIFSIFPFSMFRTPPRYLLMATFFLVTFASLILKQLIHKNSYIRFLIYSILIVNCIHLVLTAFHYHLFIDTAQIYQSVKAQKSIKKDSTYITYGAMHEWNSMFASKGWTEEAAVANYLAIAQSGMPNSNLISGQRQFDIYASMPMRRNQYITSLITDNLENASKSAYLYNLLRLFSISSIVSYKPLHIPSFIPVQQLKNGEKVLITYENAQSVKQPHFIYVPKSVKRVVTMEEVEEYMYSNRMTESDSLVESFPQDHFTNEAPVKIETNVKSDMYFKNIISSTKDTYLIYRIGWYPEWELTIDGKKAPFYRSNLVHMGFVLPKGVHVVELTYVPRMFYVGCLISTLFLGIVLFLFLKTLKRSK